MKSPITSHVLDTSQGKPAAGIEIVLEIRAEADQWQKLGSGVTNSDGRVNDLLPAEHSLASGLYRLTFETASYFKAKNVRSFYSTIPVMFEIQESGGHYHIPLLLNPYGYSTYRGS